MIEDISRWIGHLKRVKILYDLEYGIRFGKREQEENSARMLRNVRTAKTFKVRGIFVCSLFDIRFLFVFTTNFPNFWKFRDNQHTVTCSIRNIPIPWVLILSGFHCHYCVGNLETFAILWYTVHLFTLDQHHTKWIDLITKYDVSLYIIRHSLGFDFTHVIDFVSDKVLEEH